MRPANLSVLFLIILPLIVCAGWFIKIRLDRTLENVELVSNYLNRFQIKKSIFSVSIKGYYKNRPVEWRGYPSEDDNLVDILRGFRIEIEKKPLFLPDQSRPTPNTQLRGNKICYTPVFRSGLDRFSNLLSIPVLGSSQVEDVLEELTQAAEIVEASKSSC